VALLRRTVFQPISRSLEQRVVAPVWRVLGLGWIIAALALLVRPAGLWDSGLLRMGGP